MFLFLFTWSTLCLTRYPVQSSRIVTTLPINFEFYGLLLDNCSWICLTIKVILTVLHKTYGLFRMSFLLLFLSLHTHVVNLSYL